MGASGQAGKRAVDLVVGTMLAVLSVPVTLVLAVAVAVSLRTLRPIFLQERVGRAGCLFTLPKLRTLPCTAPPVADKYTIAGIATTRLGRLLRQTHLDELPQLLLVPLGRMSLVGPRPEMPSLLRTFDGDFVAARSRVRPGCSGLWQISHQAARLIREAPEYDLYYVKHSSIRLDLWIVWRSVLLMIGGRAVRLEDVPAWTRRHHRVVADFPARAAQPTMEPMT